MILLTHGDPVLIPRGPDDPLNQLAYQPLLVKQGIRALLYHATWADWLTFLGILGYAWLCAWVGLRAVTRRYDPYDPDA